MADERGRRIFRADIYDKRHIRNLIAQSRAIQSLFDDLSRDAARIGEGTRFNDPDAPFYWKNHPAAQKQVDELLASVAQQMQLIIEEGNKQEWLLANAKNDEMVKTILSSSNIPKSRLAQFSARNLDALAAFQTRKIGGMNLSDRVWALKDNLKGELELALDIGLGEGRNAGDLAREVQKYLKKPNMLFRRVRDKHGVLRLSQSAAAYHPGRGVYRSSYMNALRMTATENNMAYRTADHERWQQIDFVIGIEIQLSNNHPVVDICDELKGVYPKDFKFTGWHPFCRCHAVAKLPSQEEFIKYQQAMIDGKDVSDWNFKGEVKDVPDEFKEWLNDNYERAKTSYSMPYFIKDNLGTYVPQEWGTLFGSKMPYATYAEYEAAMRFNAKHNQFTAEQLANIRELNKALPVVQGKIMNFSEANKGHSNPNYSAKDGAKKGYHHNCQTTTMSYELRRRGFDVEAKGNPLRPRMKKMREFSKYCSDKGVSWTDRWLTKDGKKVDYEWSSATRIKDTIADKRSFIEGKASAVGRYEVYCAWKSGDAHVFIVERTLKGDLIWYDPQNGKRGADIVSYIKGMRSNMIGVLRIDDKIINPKFADRLLKSSQ